MSTNSGPVTEVLHSDKHSTLTAEEIAKAVARHNKQIPVGHVDGHAELVKPSTLGFDVTNGHPRAIWDKF